ncbi:MAG: roadblock/LC7 domain-containing protein [Candidatus Heimdallarchaeota archaeon]
MSGIESITVLSPDGLPLASAFVERENVISIMEASSLGLSNRILQTYARGNMEEIMICGAEDSVVI